LYHKIGGILSTTTKSVTFHHSAVTFIVHTTLSHVFFISFDQINVFSIFNFHVSGIVTGSHELSHHPFHHHALFGSFGSHFSQYSVSSTPSPHRDIS
jgi:hypothetical protein